MYDLWRIYPVGVRVRWDNGHTNSYRYGSGGFYDVKVVESRTAVTTTGLPNVYCTGYNRDGRLGIGSLGNIYIIALCVPIYMFECVWLFRCL